MRWWKLGVGLLALWSGALWSVAACSGDASVTAPADTIVGAEVLATGTVEWGSQPGQHFDWDLETIAGFTHALTFNTTSDTHRSSSSASRQGPEDQIWFVAATVGGGAPLFVFGGAAPEVEQVVLVDADGVQVRLSLATTPNRDWSVAVQELPEQWSAAPPAALDVVALADGSEIAREPLAGLL